jgi:hypothetical protein
MGRDLTTLLPGCAGIEEKNNSIAAPEKAVASFCHRERFEPEHRFIETDRLFEILDVQACL